MFLAPRFWCLLWADDKIDGKDLCSGFSLSCRFCLEILSLWAWARLFRSRVAEVRYFVAILRFVAIYALFGRLCVREKVFLARNSVSWAKSALLHGIYCIFQQFCKFAITCKNDAFDAKIVNTGLTEIFIAIFAPGERLPSSATLFGGTLDILWTASTLL